MASALVHGLQPTAPARANEEIIACHECGLIHRLPPMRDHTIALCRACGATIHRRVHHAIERALACYLAAALLFGVANAFPFMTLEIEGREQTGTILAGAVALHRAGMTPLGLVVLLVGTLMPLLKLLGMLYVLVPVHLDRHPPHLARAFRWIERLSPWAMMEVYLLGIIVAYVKLSDLATIELGIALFGFVALILVMTLGDALLDPHAVWRRLGPQADAAVLRPVPGTHLVSCHACDQLVRIPDRPRAIPICPRCGAALHARKPESLARTWALLIAAAILYLPANLYPIMTVISFGRGEPDTILSGVVALAEAGMIPIALLVFFASIAVPVLKLVGLAWLLVSVQRRSGAGARARTGLYRVIEAVGRWSMIDIFMIAILTALVSLGNIATVEPGVGAISFAAVVILTMLAAMTFDPRLIWDACDGRDQPHAPVRV